MFVYESSSVTLLDRRAWQRFSRKNKSLPAQLKYTRIPQNQITPNTTQKDAHFVNN